MLNLVGNSVNGSQASVFVPWGFYCKRPCTVRFYLSSSLLHCNTNHGHLTSVCNLDDIFAFLNFTMTLWALESDHCHYSAPLGHLQNWRSFMLTMAPDRAHLHIILFLGLCGMKQRQPGEEGPSACLKPWQRVWAGTRVQGWLRHNCKVGGWTFFNHATKETPGT